MESKFVIDNPVISKVFKLPLLDREEEIELSERSMAGDRSAGHLLVAHNSRWIQQVCQGFVKPGCDIDDLFSNALYANLKAVTKYDWRLGTFAGYSYMWTVSACQFHDASFSTPRKVPQIGVTGKRAVRDAMRMLGVDGSIESEQMEIAEETGKHVANVFASVAYMLGWVSLDADLPNEERNLLDRLGGIEEDDFGSIATLAAAALSHLSEFEQRALSMRYGLAGHEEMTLREIGEALGCSGEWVRQVIDRAIYKIRLSDEYSLHVAEFRTCLSA